jgi:hypothetical protein
MVESSETVMDAPSDGKAAKATIATPPSIDLPDTIAQSFLLKTSVL